MLIPLLSQRLPILYFRPATVLLRFTLLGTLICVLGCGQSSEKQEENTHKAVRVRLPKPPDLSKPLPPLQWEDEVYTVRGALKNSFELKGQPVSVRGTVVEVRMCQETDEWKCMLPSHILLTDDLDRSAKRIAVVGNRLRDFGELRVGQKIHRLDGQMSTVSLDGRLVAMEGLVNLEPVEEAPKRKRKRKRRSKKRRKKRSRIDITRP